MKLKQFEGALQQVDTFENPKYELEQYPTSAHLASRLIFTADATFDDIEDKAVLDLGCGTGMLGLGATMLGAGYTLGVDIDPEALEIAKRNVDDFEVEMDLINLNVAELCDEEGRGALPLQSFDTVVMNPPFGTRTKGIDVVFLETALKLSTGAVYSMHKSTTREFLQKKATRDWGVNFEVIAELKFDIPKMYKFHKKKSADVYVDLIRLSRNEVMGA